MKKISENLAQQIKSDKSEIDMLDVIVELDQKSGINTIRDNSESRISQIAERKESFARISEPVEDTIHQVGGKVLEKAWINRTLRAKLPAAGLEKVSELEEVEILDSPHDLESE